MSELLAGFTGRWDRRIEAVEGVEIWVIWSRRRDAWTYLGGADAGWRRNSGLSYPERRPGGTSAAYRIPQRVELFPRAVNGRDLLLQGRCV